MNNLGETETHWLQNDRSLDTSSRRTIFDDPYIGNDDHVAPANQGSVGLTNSQHDGFNEMDYFSHLRRP